MGSHRFIAPAVLSAIVLSVSAADWPQWRGLNRDGISSETEWSARWPKEGPRKLWSAVVGVGYSSCAVVQGRLYTMGNARDIDAVFCLDAETGRVIWKHVYRCSPDDPNGFEGPRCTPTVADGKVYTVSRRGHLFCLDTANGRVIWRKQLQRYGGKPPKWGFSTSPLVVGRSVIVEAGGPGASLVAFDKETGAEIWKAGDDRAGYSSPIIGEVEGEEIVVAFTADGLVARDLERGLERWVYPWKTSYGVNAATPVMSDGRVFISSGYNRGCALIDVRSEPIRTVWKNREMRNHVNSSVLWDGYLYGFDESRLKCLDFETGESMWSHRGFGKGSLIIAGGRLIVFGESGQLAVAEASPEGYRELAAAQVVGGSNTWALPVLSDGKLYCRSLEKLVCLDLRDGAGP